MKHRFRWLVVLGFVVGFAQIAPARAQEPQPLRVAIIGDYGVAGNANRDVAALVDSWQPATILTVGDNNYPVGDQTTIDANIGQYYHEYIGAYTGAYGAGATQNRFFPSLGNHDWYTLGAIPYLNYFTLPNNERYYTFVLSDVQFFALDSDPNEPDGISNTSVQAQWLRDQLAASTAAWQIVYFHHSPYSSASHGSNPTLQWDFKAWGVDAVITGHDHDYERIIVDGLVYLVNGLGGNPSRYPFTEPPVAGSVMRYNDKHGALLLEADALHLTFSFITIDNTVVDTYTIKQPLRIYLPLLQILKEVRFKLWAETKR